MNVNLSLYNIWILMGIVNYQKDTIVVYYKGGITFYFFLFSTFSTNLW